ncbi:unnamed protein product [Ambrosiozyma monospora]|uniref:Unnamed protein product n=1 Tax=Ambrosiozyma monospora TaxID=43982 RepID=A0A9W7DH14_AMBMO|nr:unnamed protein product [Ambrosiozyma monospora]
MTTSEESPTTKLDSSQNHYQDQVVKDQEPSQKDQASLSKSTTDASKTVDESTSQIDDEFIPQHEPTNSKFEPVENMPDNLTIPEIIKLLSSHYSIPEILIKSLFNLNGRSSNVTPMQQIPGGQQQQQTVSDDKCFIENLESEIIGFIVKPNVDSWKLTPLNSYYRLLTHKVSEYYNLGHILSNDGYSMVLYKINTSLVNADDETKKTAKFDEDGNIKPLDFRNLN